MKKTGKILSAALIMAAVSALTCAAVSAQTVEVSCNGSAVNLTAAPFVDNSEVYLPLREVLNACGVSNDVITYDNGKITFAMYSAPTGKNVTAEINVGQCGIKFDADKDNFMVTSYSGGVRTTSHPVILKDGVTYAPMGVFRRIKDFGIDLRYNSVSADDDAAYTDDFRYSRATRYLMLDNLEVKKIYDDGQFDVLLSRELDVKGENKYDPASYYSENERVIIGTPKQQNETWPSYNSVNGYYFPTDPIKRIITDADGKVAAVVLVQNQYHETINRADGDTYGVSCVDGFGHNDDVGSGTGLIMNDGVKCSGRMLAENRENRAEMYFWIPTYLMVQPY